MIARNAAEGIAVLSGIGGFLSCLALHIAARGISSLRHPKKLLTSDPHLARPSTLAAQSNTVSGYWRERGNRLVGTYNTQNDRYAGYIANWQSPKRRFYIVYPPKMLQRHCREHQLVDRGNGRYLIRFGTRPNCVGDGIRAIEQLLTEAEAKDASRNRPDDGTQEAHRTLVRPVEKARVEIRPITRPRVAIQPKYRPYWEMQDWRIAGNKLIGEYKTPLGSFAGYITHFRSREPLFFITNPPPQLWTHPHRACFRRKKGGHYWVHFGEKPKNPDSGIRQIEKILAEALRLPRR